MGVPIVNVPTSLYRSAEGLSSKKLVASPPDMNAQTEKGGLAMEQAPKNVSIWGCWSVLQMSISLWKIWLSNKQAASRNCQSAWFRLLTAEGVLSSICLTATVVPSQVALKTFPNPPLPSCWSWWIMTSNEVITNESGIFSAVKPALFRAPNPRWRKSCSEGLPILARCYVMKAYEKSSARLLEMYFVDS